ncbi:MAG: threonine--tRNA ligase [Myxococcota bacterium]
MSKQKINLETLRHSTAHVMADAVKQLFPEAKVTIGPSIENGFYYDFDVPEPFKEEDLEKIEAKMKEIIKKGEEFKHKVVSRKEAENIFREMGETYKLEILQDIPEDEEVSLYAHGDFVDLCRGPHLDSTRQIGAFKLLHTAGAYWRGNENNKMLQRIYGTAFKNRKDLRIHLRNLEEAKKRDHRKLGKEMDLFSISEEIGGGLILWHPKGGRVRKIMEDFWRQKHMENGYELVFTPHIARENLWQTSGHLDFYKESMFQGMEIDGVSYLAKPMNCPYHIMIYNNNMHSYRDLPYRWAELGTVYRNEKSGVLHGLFRVRGFTQDDAHLIFARKQLKDELQRVFKFTLSMLQAFGFEDFICRLATRPKGKCTGSDEIWREATDKLQKLLEEWGGEYEVDEGGGAFYGPKIDIALKDSLGREWQCSTIQLDFNLPERFEMTFINSAGNKEQPIMVHRALLGSIERFFGILIEHYNGKFPLWLAPEQVRVLTISDQQQQWAAEVTNKLKTNGIRASLDNRNEKLGYKVREAQIQKVPYALVIGDREVTEKSVTPRPLGKKSKKIMPFETFLGKIQGEAQWPDFNNN